VSEKPTFGTTQSGRRVHASTRDHLPEVLRLNLRALRQAIQGVEGFNAKLAVIITSGVGTMACAYVFAAIALISLPDAIRNGRATIISWIAQTFLQLVLLSIIMVGQRVQSAASDARAEKTFEDSEIILDRLDASTAGGIADLMTAIEDLGRKIDGAPAGGATPRS